MPQCRTNTESVPVLSGAVLSRSIMVGCTREEREVCDWDPKPPVTFEAR
jgi:hypothetical protein